MKRVLVGLLIVVVVVAAGAGITAWSILGRSTSIVDGATHGPVTTIRDGYVACYLVDVGSGKFALVDTCNDPAAGAIVATLKSRNASTDDVLAIFITHGHRDHVSGARVFDRAQVFAHSDEIDLIEGRVDALGTLTKHDTDRPTAKVTGRLSHEQTVGVGTKRFESLHLPGHTAGSVAILVDGVLMLGDSGNAREPDLMVPPPEVFTDDVEQNIESLVKLADMVDKREVKVVLPSHSGPLEPSAIRRFAETHERE